MEEGYDCEKHNTNFQKTGSQVFFFPLVKHEVTLFCTSRCKHRGRKGGR